MTEKNAPKWSQIKKKIESFDTEGLIGLVKDLFEYSTDNQSFLAARFLAHGDRGAALEAYRRRVMEPFYPKRGFGKLNLSQARKAIRDYRKASGDLAGTIELMLTYVETGTRFTNEFGDIDEPFYNSLESALGEMAKLLKTPEGAELYPRFRKRVCALADQMDWLGVW